ncbi:MAG: alpha/beta hydrolase [Saprospiraceae bacterium]
MNQKISIWKESGHYISYGPFAHQIFVKELGTSTASSDKTLLLIHGFPESSFSYHLVINELMSVFDRIVLFDFIGYGLSNKPTDDFTYSLFEQTDVLLTVWHHFGVKGGHMLSHDMGDSVATEVIARHCNNLMPIWLSDGLKSVTLTNGSMVLDLADLRITQKILLSKWGSYFKNIISFSIFKKQIISAHGNDNLKDEEIALLWEFNLFQDGHKKTYLTIKYLNDRKRFEKTRWLPALNKCDLPIHLCWGSDDKVARVEMAEYLKLNICTNAELTIMKGVGHFCQIGSPEIWVESILNYYKKVSPL